MDELKPAPGETPPVTLLTYPCLSCMRGRTTMLPSSTACSTSRVGPHQSTANACQPLRISPFTHGRVDEQLTASSSAFSFADNLCVVPCLPTLDPYEAASSPWEPCETYSTGTAPDDSIPDASMLRWRIQQSGLRRECYQDLRLSKPFFGFGVRSNKADRQEEEPGARQCPCQPGVGHAPRAR
jgi:hypothetical protein